MPGKAPGVSSEPLLPMLEIAPVSAIARSLLMKEDKLLCRAMSGLPIAAAASSVVNATSILYVIMGVSGAGLPELRFRLVSPLGMEFDRGFHDDMLLIPQLLEAELAEVGATCHVLNFRRSTPLRVKGGPPRSGTIPTTWTEANLYWCIDSGLIQSNIT